MSLRAHENPSGEAQLDLFARPKRGGRRRGAGAKRKASRPSPPHRARPRVTRHTPVHVTLRMVGGLETLRSRRGYRAFVKTALAARARLDMRIVAWSLQRDHVHMVVEAPDARSLARAM